MLQLSANGQSLMSHIDDDGIMTMMWAKMSAVIAPKASAEGACI